MKRVASTKGFEIIVDDEDYHLVASHRWTPACRPGNERPARQIGGRTTYLYHLIVGRPPEGMMVDHINGNPWDNRRSNLRFATRSQNQRNRKLTRGFSGKGAVHMKRDGKWQGHIQVDGVAHYLGRYATRLEAELAYDAAALYLHGEFARLGHPEIATVAKSPEQLRAHACAVAKAARREKSVSQIDTDTPVRKVAA